MAEILKRITDWYRYEYGKNPIFMLFLTVMVLLLSIFVISTIATGGETFYNTLFHNRNDTFMDYFNSIMYSADRPYSRWHVIYPPLVTVFYMIMGYFTVPFASTAGVLSFEIRDSQMGIMSYFIVTLVTIYALHLILRRILSNEEDRMRVELLFILLIFSFPFIYALERGNSILMALVFSLIFIGGYRSENRVIRYASYVALGCAAGIKLYPALLGLLLIRDRRWKEALVCMGIGIAIVLLPFVFTDGNMFILWESISSYSAVRTPPSNITNLSRLLFVLLHEHAPRETVSLITNIVLISFTAMSILVVMLDKRMKFWKVVALIACNLIIGPGVGTEYAYIYMTLPIVFFIAQEKKPSASNLFYLACFALTMSLLVGFELCGSTPFDVISTMRFGVVLIMASFLLFEGILDLISEFRKKHLAARNVGLSTGFDP